MSRCTIFAPCVFHVVFCRAIQIPKTCSRFLFYIHNSKLTVIPCKLQGAHSPELDFTHNGKQMGCDISNSHDFFVFFFFCPFLSVLDASLYREILPFRRSFSKEETTTCTFGLNHVSFLPLTKSYDNKQVLFFLCFANYHSPCCTVNNNVYFPEPEQ